MSTALLPDVVSKIDANPGRFCGQHRGKLGSVTLGALLASLQNTRICSYCWAPTAYMFLASEQLRHYS